MICHCDLLLSVSVIAINKQQELRYLLCFGAAGSKDRLRKLGPTLFFRNGSISLAGLGGHEIDELDMFDVPNYYILTDPVPANLVSSFQFRHMAIHVPVDPVFTLGGDSTAESVGFDRSYFPQTKAVPFWPLSYGDRHGISCHMSRWYASIFRCLVRPFNFRAVL